MTVIEYAEHRLREEVNVRNGDWDYWRGYIDGAKAQKREDEVKKDEQTNRESV